MFLCSIKNSLSFIFLQSTYNINTKQGSCFAWNENESKLGANEFSIIISYFIEQETRDPPKNQELIFYSYGCCSENRNATLANTTLLPLLTILLLTRNNWNVDKRKWKQV